MTIENNNGNPAANNNASRPGYKSRQAEARERRKGEITRRCKAVGLDGPCKNWTTVEFCAAHEWKMTELVMSAHQSFRLMLPFVIQELRHVIQDGDHDTKLRGIMVYWKMQGDKPISNDIATINELDDLTVPELVERAQLAISALQQPIAPELAPAQDTPDGNSNGNSPDNPGARGAAWSGSETQQDASVAANGGKNEPLPGTQQTAADGPYTAPDGNA